ncbi:hypothetical protein HDU91_002735, partial [Kappamyces sp. JEL0680]
MAPPCLKGAEAADEQETQNKDEFDEDFDDLDDLGIFDTTAIEDNGEKGENEKELDRQMFGDEDSLNGFIEDDDGGGYKEDLRKQEGYLKYQERAKKESLQALQKEFPMDDMEALDYLPDRPSEQVQGPFQSASAPAKGNREYMCFNMHGTICQITSSSSDSYVLDIAFHDTSARPFHFTSSIKYFAAVLGSAGGAFASAATSFLPSTLHYRPADNWASKNDWTVSLPEGETCLAIALSLY